MPVKPLVSPPGVPSSSSINSGPDRIFQADLNNPLRKGCFYFVVILVFVRFSMLHQLLTYKMGINLFLLYIFGLPGIIGFLFTGGFRRVFRFRTAIYWTGFAACMIGSSVFSTWRGGSLSLVAGYLRTDFLMLFVIGGVAVGWKECRTLLVTLSIAVLMSEITIKLFAHVDLNGRTNLEFGTIQNSNDYAAHLILVLPFLLWSALSLRNFIFRAVAILGLGYGFYLITASGSRGGFIALLVSVLTVLFTVTQRQRIVGFVLAGVMLVSAVAFVPVVTFQRILSFSDTADSSQEALQSSHIRKQLLQDSIWFAVTHPVFGLGAGQFNENEGHTRKLEGQVGLYYDAHNSFMTVASECGIPALIFYLAGIVSCVSLLNSVRRKVASNLSASDVRNAVVCMKAAVFGYCVAIAFVNFAYFFYLPALAGLISVLAGSFPGADGLPATRTAAWRPPYTPGPAGPGYRKRSLPQGRSGLMETYRG